MSWWGSLVDTITRTTAAAMAAATAAVSDGGTAPEKPGCAAGDICASPIYCDGGAKTCLKVVSAKATGVHTQSHDPPCGNPSTCARTCIKSADIAGAPPLSNPRFQASGCVRASSGWDCGAWRTSDTRTDDCGLGWCRWSDIKVSSSMVCGTFKNWSEDRNRKGRIVVEY